MSRSWVRLPPSAPRRNPRTYRGFLSFFYKDTRETVEITVCCGHEGESSHSDAHLVCGPGPMEGLAVEHSRARQTHHLGVLIPVVLIAIAMSSLCCMASGHETSLVEAATFEGALSWCRP